MYPMATKVTEKQELTIKPKKDRPRANVPAPSASRDNSFSRVSRYLREVQVELRKTTWPSKQELIASTQVVLGLLAVVGVYIFVVDVLVTQFFKLSHLGPQG